MTNKSSVGFPTYLQDVYLPKRDKGNIEVWEPILMPLINGHVITLMRYYYIKDILYTYKSLYQSSSTYVSVESLYILNEIIDKLTELSTGYSQTITLYEELIDEVKNLYHRYGLSDQLKNIRNSVYKEYDKKLIEKLEREN